MTTSFLCVSIRLCSGDLVELQWTGRNVLVGGSKTLHGIHLAARKRNRKCRLRRYEANAWTPGVGSLKAGENDRHAVAALGCRVIWPRDDSSLHESAACLAALPFVPE